MNIWTDMGFGRWPLLFALLAVVGLSAYAAFRLFGQEARPDARTRALVDAILFWGGFALVWGVLATLIGFSVAAQSIEMAGEVSGALVWGGIKVALLTAQFGMLILILAGLNWFGLQYRWRMLAAQG